MGWHRGPRGVEAPELGCNFVEGLRGEVWLSRGQGSSRKGWVCWPAVQTEGAACEILVMMMVVGGRNDED